MLPNKTITPVYALTVNNNGISDCIITPVDVTNIVTGQKIETMGIWDTGATNSVITKSVALALGLSPIRTENVRGVHGVMPANVYYVNMTLNNKKITINAAVTECDELSADNSVGMLIGMNVVNKGDFAITNYHGKTTMSFRVPSVQKIDFVTSMRETKQVVNTKIPSRNDQCPCGSGKKYKHCCGN